MPGVLKIWVAPVSNVNITLYHKQNTAGVGNGYNVFWSTTCGSGWNVWTTNDCNGSDGCVNDLNVISVAQNTTIYVYVEDCGNNNGISFNASDNTSTCPSNTANYCDTGDCLGTPFSFNSGTSNKNIAVTVVTNKFGYTACV